MDIYGIFGSEGMGEEAFSPERYSPEVVGFDEYSELSNRDVETLINNLLPGEHLENCNVISCDPNFPLWQMEPDVLGVHTEFKDGTPSEIYLAGKENFEGGCCSEIDVLLHEIGHEAYLSLDLDDTIAWSEIHVDSMVLYEQTGLGFVSAYAHSDLFEDFAESYSAYVTRPDLLQFFSPEKYEFMRDHVFGGREYDVIVNNDGTATLMAKNIAQPIQATANAAPSSNALIESSANNSPIPPDEIYRCFSMIS